MIDTKELFKDAICSISVDYRMESLLPKKLVSFDERKGGYGIVRKWLDAYTSKELCALYVILKSYEVFKKLYDGFVPMCDEEIEYEKMEKRYLEIKGFEYKKNYGYYPSHCEIADAINFNILHSMSVEDKKLADLLCKKGLFTPLCIMNREDMKKKSEGVKEQKLRDVLSELIQIRL